MNKFYNYATPFVFDEASSLVIPSPNTLRYNLFLEKLESVKKDKENLIYFLNSIRNNKKKFITVTVLEEANEKLSLILNEKIEENEELKLKIISETENSQEYLGKKYYIAKLKNKNYLDELEILLSKLKSLEIYNASNKELEETVLKNKIHAIESKISQLKAEIFSKNEIREQNLKLKARINEISSKIIYLNSTIHFG